MQAELKRIGATQSVHTASVKEITVQEYNADPSQWYLVDVREEKELKNMGPIAGMAGHVALGDALRLASMNQLPADWQGKKVLLYCGSGRRSAVAAREIATMDGNLDLYSLAGGFKAWKATQTQ